MPLPNTQSATPPQDGFQLNDPIVLDPYFAFEHQSAVQGRVANFEVTPTGVRVTLLRAGAPERQFLIRAADPTDLTRLRPGDHVAFTVVADSTTTLSIVSRAENELPPATGWNNPTRQEERLRFREVDVLLRPAARHMIATRSAIVFAIRQYLQQLGFLEVELPVLKRRPDIAPAPHFEVIDSNGRKLYLRTTFPAFERLFVSFDRAYTIGPNFRNGDWSHKNIPEFTMLCLMVRGTTYLETHRLVRTMMAEVVAAVTGSSIVKFRGVQFDLRSWQEVSLDDALAGRYGVRLDDLDDDEAMAAFASRHRIALPTPHSGGHMFRAALFDRIFETLIVPAFPGPTFFTEVPWYLAGPAERHPTNGGVKLRGEGYVAGMELTNAKNVLTDFDALRTWHHSIADEKRRAGFPDEYAAIDTDYLRSAGYGLQPGALSSIGIDRLIMLALGVDNITEAVMYPLP